MTRIFEEMEEALTTLEDGYQEPFFWTWFSENHVRDGIPFDYKGFRQAISNLHAADANICFTNVHQYGQQIMQEYVRLLDQEALLP